MKGTEFICQSCSASVSKWTGRCPSCGAWNTLVEERVPKGGKAAAARRGSLSVHAGPPKAVSLDEALEDEAPRVSSGMSEVDRVLGGGLVKGSVVLLGGEPGVGKCLTGDTRVLDPATGDYLPIAEWVGAQRGVLALDPATHRLIPRPVTAFFDQGVRAIVEVTTRLGRVLRCTPSHPVLTPDGWRAIGELPAGTRIASPRVLPWFGSDPIPDHELRLIAYALSDGSAQSSVNVTSMLPEVERDLEAIAQAFGMALRAYTKARCKARQFRFVMPRDRRVEARSTVASALWRIKRERQLTWTGWARAAGVRDSALNTWRRGKAVPRADILQRLAAAAKVSLDDLAPLARDRAEDTTPAARVLEACGLRYATAATKHVPDAVFRAPREQLATFLKVLFSCDGSVFVNAEGSAGVSYATISRRLAEDVQHLLLRFGLVARLRTKRSVLHERAYTAYEVQLLGVPQVRRFLRDIGIWGRDEARAAIDALPRAAQGSTQFDTIPTGHDFWDHLRGATGHVAFRDVSQQAGVFLRDRRHDRPLRRSTVEAPASAWPTPLLHALAFGDVYWDETVEVRAAGEARVYDLSVPGFENFVAGDLIVHNSTLLAQLVAHIATAAPERGGVLYVSGEESNTQVAARAKRLGIGADAALRIAATGELEDVINFISKHDPAVVAVDSIQTLRSADLESAAGSVSQLREVTARLVTLAKQEGRTMLVVGHVTKDGLLAGPKVLEHLVDVVLSFDGQRSGGPRILRSLKNRFGASGELAVMEMTREGLRQVADPSSLFLAERPRDVPGSAVVAAADGERPLLLEVQALVTPSALPSPRRVATGIDVTRISILTAVLGQRANLAVRDRDVFVSVAGGASVDEPAADLAVACAIASSVVDLALPMDLVVFGEIGLAGEIRAVPRCTPRLEEAVKLGFRRALVPRANVERGEIPPGLVVHGVAHAREVAAWIERKSRSD